MNTKKINELKTLMDRWNATGRLAFHYPRKKMVSLDGGSCKTEEKAIEYLRDFFDVQ